MLSISHVDGIILLFNDAGSLTIQGEIIPPSVVKALKSLYGDILADAHAGPISMKEFGNPLFSILLSKEFKYFSV